MTTDNIKQLYLKTKLPYGYALEIQESHSTNSVYFTLRYAEDSLFFRVSDHKGKVEKVSCLRVDLNTTQKTALGFLNNKCKELSKRRTVRIMNSLAGR